LILKLNSFYQDRLGTNIGKTQLKTRTTVFSTEIYNVSAVHLMDGWVFIEPANGLQAWAAVKYLLRGIYIRNG